MQYFSQTPQKFVGAYGPVKHNNGLIMCRIMRFKLTTSAESWTISQAIFAKFKFSKFYINSESLFLHLKNYYCYFIKTFSFLAFSHIFLFVLSFHLFFILIFSFFIYTYILKNYVTNKFIYLFISFNLV